AKELAYQNPQKNKINDIVEVLINPFVGYKKSLYGQDINREGAPKEFVPFWIPACLNKMGQLTPHPYYKPWIAREWLSGSQMDPVKLDYHTIGDIDSVDLFTSSYRSDFNTWNDLWTYVDKLSISVTKQSMHELKHPTYVRGEVGQNCYVRIAEFGQGMTRNIMGLYNDLIRRSQELPSLLKQYVSLKDKEELNLLSGELFIQKATQHLGQMSNEFPVSVSQRQSIHHYLTISDGEMLAVNGPPGTGKTTMLQSIVATMWTKAALDRTDPPVILAASTNNKAVTNVIDSFGKVEERGCPELAGRWLPQLNSYGLYLVRSGKEDAEKFQCYHPVNKDNPSNGFPMIIENKSYLQNAEQYYLEKYNQYAKTTVTDIKDVVKNLHSKLVQVVQGLETKILSLSSIDLEKVDAKLGTLDINERYTAFKLATHYFEGQWLLEMKEELNKGNSYLEFTLDSQKKKWRRFAKLTPCFVSTMHMTPAFFKYGITSTEYLYDFIDLLIVDEAGQVNPEVAGASFAIAKKALVVGDVVQIPPIWNIPLAIDIQNIIKLGLANNEQEAIVFVKDTYLGSSSGSVMQVAQRATKYRVDKLLAKGMFLKEHRRCVKDIIGYCNELAYNGFLEPLAKEFGQNEYFLPHMGYAHINGNHDNSNGNSNTPEAQAIVNWIDNNKLFLENYYSKKENKKLKIGEIIGVITPFTKQTSVIKEALRKSGLNDITVGTVHALQGAERSICIFSPVYDSNYEGSYFFDNGVNMLNVAVSRAKHSFLVFGDMEIFENSNKRTPSGLLAEYLFKSEKNKLDLNKRVYIPNISSFPTVNI
ncbi:AAA domain-containing protein, partial [Priestia megaterium]